MEAKKYKCLMFDFDGTLFDTDELNFRAYKSAYKDLGVDITEQMFRLTHGMSVYKFNEIMGVDCDVHELIQRKQYHYKKISLSAKPNYYLIGLVKFTNLKTVLVTTARYENIRPLLEKYNIEFDYMVTQDNVKNHKPDPECYELAMRKAGVISEQCLAFEDSEIGVTAAKRAGIDCLRINEFSDCCIMECNGGSGCRTYVDLLDDRLCVFKWAKNMAEAKRLTNQFRAIQEDKSGMIVEASLKEKQDGEVLSYYMPYLFGENLHHCVNKTQYLADLILAINYRIKFGNVRENRFDRRDSFWYSYIKPGIEIYETFTGEEFGCVSKWEDIPCFVSNFRRTVYHGDTTFENTMVLYNGTIKMIDPVPDGNVVDGVAHDFSKVAQSLMGYEAIRDGMEFDYSVELEMFDDMSRNLLTEEEYKSLKFYTACLFLRRLKHQQFADESLVKPYGDIAKRLLVEFLNGDYSWKC